MCRCSVEIAHRFIAYFAAGKCLHCTALDVLHRIQQAEDEQPFGIYPDLQRLNPELTVEQIAEGWEAAIAAADEIVLGTGHTCVVVH